MLKLKKTSSTLKALMVQGTGSGVGKSIIVAGLCRIFRDMGIKTAPFKAQNMALNSFVTKEGGEIGRAQALQAEACGIEPSIYMNPILLKASGNSSSQVIVLGKVHSTMEAKRYYEFKDEAWQAVTTAWDALADNYDLIVLEGAGSPAEINLMDKDIVNMKMAHYAKANVILVGDIEKGGVFASLYGTYILLGNYGKLIKAFIINKFRGDKDILDLGNKMIFEKTGIPVIGTLPYLTNLKLSEEDGLALTKRHGFQPQSSCIKIVVIKLQYISNFTDVEPFLHEPDVDIIYSTQQSDILSADLIILPGTKNTVKDLLYIKMLGIHTYLQKAVNNGTPIIGICGGYQMLGLLIKDPYAVETTYKEVKGLGYLECVTIFDKTKTTCQVTAQLKTQIPFVEGTFKDLLGYEIHMGTTCSSKGMFDIHEYNKKDTHPDGSQKDNVLGTYLHGIFDNDHFRRAIINGLRIKKGLKPLTHVVNYKALKDKAINEWACVLKTHLDMKFIEKLIS
ncbi:MAG: cobyric acid synthase [Candidatus Magnetoovum sp. WYHC-5]|nr:cobyric acid synthase [Candidatus Magnetoovum sp. WYHC-5]